MGEWSSALGASVEAAWVAVSAYLPNALGALALLVVGGLFARLLQSSVTRLVARLDKLVPKRLFEREVGPMGMDRFASQLVGRLVFWAVFLFFVAAAAEALQLPVATSGLARFSGYLPNVIAAGAILFVGLVLGNFVRGAIIAAAASAGVAYGDGMGRSLKLAVLLVAGVVAVDQLGVESTLLIATLTIVVGAVIGSIGLAFGLGAQTAVSNIIAAHHVTQLYRMGQHVRLEGIEGELVEFRAIGVVLRTRDGRVFVPAKRFAEVTSTALTKVS
jgi:small-conductance mechanosensitive channel